MIDLMKPAVMSSSMAKATDALLCAAMEALTTAGADFGSAPSDRHTLVIHGIQLRCVVNALDDWAMQSCEPDACETWNLTQPRAAQGAYEAVERAFPKDRNLFDVDDGTRIPMSIFGSHLIAITDAQETWQKSWNPPHRPRPN